MTHPWVMDNNCVKYYPDPTWHWGVMARTRIFGMCALWPWPQIYDLDSRSWHTLWSWTTIVWNIIQIGQGDKKLWPGHNVNRRTERQTDRRMDRQTDREGDSYIPPKLCLRGYNNIQIQLGSEELWPGSEELWPGHGVRVCVLCDLDLGDMTFGQGHDTSLGHGQ